jgi:hypothetical protein
MLVAGYHPICLTNVPRRYIDHVAAPAKLTHADVKQIRRRVHRGECQTELAVEFGVNRKTIRRRLDALDSAEREQAEYTAERRLHRQAARQRRELLHRLRAVGQSSAPKHSDPPIRLPVQPVRPRGHYYNWLDKPKSLSGRAFADATDSFAWPEAEAVGGLTVQMLTPISTTAGCLRIASEPD